MAGQPLLDFEDGREGVQDVAHGISLGQDIQGVKVGVVKKYLDDVTISRRGYDFQQLIRRRNRGVGV
jgi:hypothetical protein